MNQALDRIPNVGLIEDLFLPQGMSFIKASVIQLTFALVQMTGYVCGQIILSSAQSLVN